MFIPDPDLDFLPIQHPGFRGKTGPGSGSETLEVTAHSSVFPPSL